MNNRNLQKYLERYGWEYQTLQEETLVTHFDTENDERFLITFQAEKPWLRISIPSFLTLPENVTSDFLTKLLTLNADSRMVKFAIQNDIIVAMVELYYIETVSYKQFEVALDSLSYIAETAFQYLFQELGPDSTK